MTILTCDLENRLSRSSSNMQNSLTFTLNNGQTFNTWKSKLQQCMVYETGHLLNELRRNWRFSATGRPNFSIQILKIFNIYCDTKYTLGHGYAFFSSGSERISIADHFWKKLKNDQWPYLNCSHCNLTLKVKCRDTNGFVWDLGPCWYFIAWLSTCNKNAIKSWF